MAFPSTPLAVKIELWLVDYGGWTDVTPWVRVADGITITRGRADEATATEPASCKFTVDNLDGRFSPRNPVGAWYGDIGRNTRVRASVLGFGGVRLLFSEANSTAQCPDSAGTSITGDIDLRFDARLASWAMPAADQAGGGFIHKTATQRSYRLLTDPNGHVVLAWSANGTTDLVRTSTIKLPQMSGRQAIRATLDVDNGAGGHTVTFYTSDTMAGTWTQLGAPVVTAGTTSIFDSNMSLTIDIDFAEVYSIKVLQGIGGTERANPNFTTAAEGATTLTDAAGNIWTFTRAALTSRRYRFYGEVSSWPTRWGLNQKDVTASVEGAGLLRRLGQGDSPLRSAYDRAVTGRAASLIGYWPLEDPEGSTVMASQVAGVRPMKASGLFSGAPPELAADATSFPGSAPLPLMGPTGSFDVSIDNPSAAAVAGIQLRFLLNIPAAGLVNSVSILGSVTTTPGSLGWVYLIYTNGVGLSARISDGTPTGWIDTGAIGGFAGVPSAVLLQITNTTMTLTRVSHGVAVVSAAATIPTASRYPVRVLMGQGYDLTGVTIGQVSLQGALTSWSELYSPDGAGGSYAIEDAFIGEPAATRVARLCAEQGVPYVGGGDPSSSVAMGPQKPLSFLALLAQCVDADLGILIEPRESSSLRFRPRASLYNQVAALAVAYANLNELTPTDDDQGTRNDITVTRTGGSSFRRTLTVGPLSTAPPPGGVGVYDTSVEINVESDDDLADQAGWRLRQGTIDETRFPTITLSLNKRAFAANPALTSAALDLDQGDLLTISGPPPWMPADTIRQIAQGFTERLAPYSYDIVVNCTPASEWDVGTYDAPAANIGNRYSSDGSVVQFGVTSTSTLFTVNTPSGPLWTTDPAEMPFDILVTGEQVTVTAIGAPAGTSQTFTVTRSVNGVVKPHDAGDPVELYRPAHYAL